MSEIKTLNGYEIVDMKARDDLAALTDEMDATTPKMMARDLLADKSGWQDGYYVAYSTGEVLPLDGYTTTDFIRIGNAGMVEVGYGVGMFAFYNANKEFMWPGVGIESPEHVDPQHYIIPAGVAYVRFSLLSTLKDKACAYLLNDNTGPVFYVGKFGNTVAIDGVRQYYDKITDAVNEAVKYRNSTVYIADGQYDILAELGEEYLAQTFHDNLRGIELYNNIKIVGTPRVYLIAQYSGDNTTVKGYFSIFNISGSATVENVNFIGKNIRYCVHDEVGGKQIPHCETRYTMCYFQLDNTQNEQCRAMCGIGCGLGYHNTLTIEECVFDSPVTDPGWPDIYAHNHFAGNSRSRVTIRNNYCKNSSIWVTYYGESTEISTLIITGNSVATPITAKAETEDSTIVNVDFLIWNNEVRNDN